jgi:benzodiazapine receptor
MRPKTLAITAGAAFVTAAVGGLASGPAVQSDWYAQLTKPGFQPPRQVFPVVWPMLYADIAVVSASTLDELTDRGESDTARSYSRLLALNLLLNGGWSWLFFNRRWLGASAVGAAALTASSVDLGRRSVAVRGAAAGPLALYPAWCVFATALSARIWSLNRGR